MPNKEKDPSANEKKRHIGNDFVAIVYNNSDEEYEISTMKVYIVLYFIYQQICTLTLTNRALNYCFLKYRDNFCMLVL